MCRRIGLQAVWFGNGVCGFRRVWIDEESGFGFQAWTAAGWGSGKVRMTMVDVGSGFRRGGWANGGLGWRWVEVLTMVGGLDWG